MIASRPRTFVAAALLYLSGVCRATPPPSGWISVISTPPGANITIDGQKVGQPANATFALSPGRHTVLISGGAGNLHCLVTIAVESGRTKEIQCPQSGTTG
jgi:hypothetical protein